jgi:glycosyltransferase involved in cell wall biosynthesis
MSALVSVVVPNFNHQDFLAQRLKTIAEQSYANLEIILLDDASTDNSMTLLEAFAESEPRVTTLIKNQHNSGGAFAQWIKGVAQAKGKYLWIAETDDFSDLGFVETLVAQLEQNDQAAVAYSHSNWVDNQENDLGLMDIYLPYFKHNYWLADGCFDGDEINRDFMPYRNVIRNASSAVFRVATFNAALSGFTVSGRIDDWLFYVGLLKAHKVCFVAQPLNFCRLHASNFSRSLTSQSYYKNSVERINVLRKIQNLYPKQTTSVLAALNILWRNRFKYKAVDKLLSSHQDFGKYGLYGFNDLSKYFVSRCFVKPKCIFDKKVLDSFYTDISLSHLSETELSKLDSVIIMSIFYRENMRQALKEMGFKGQVFCLPTN